MILSKACKECGLVVFYKTDSVNVFCPFGHRVIGLKSGIETQRTRSSYPNPWTTIHTRYAQSTTWDEQTEREWYETKWLPTIPNYGCKCRDDWSKLTKENSIDFSSAESAFESLWLLHNKVNEKLSKPTITLQEAIAMYKEKKWPQSQ